MSRGNEVCEESATECGRHKKCWQNDTNFSWSPCIRPPLDFRGRWVVDEVAIRRHFSRPSVHCLGLPMPKHD